jgi:hypothetical protein
VLSEQCQRLAPPARAKDERERERERREKLREAHEDGRELHVAKIMFFEVTPKVYKTGVRIRERE